MAVARWVEVDRRMDLSTLRRALAVIPAVLLFSLTGCFSERSFPGAPKSQSARRVEVSPQSASHVGPSAESPGHQTTNAPAASQTECTRNWAADTNALLASKLPAGDIPPMLTADLVRGADEPADVFAHFHRDPRQLRSVFYNLTGLQHTAQATSSVLSIENAPPPWPGFEDIWIPILPGVELSGRIGFAERDGQRIDADCIVMLPGLLGDNGGQRTIDVAQFLRNSGFHVLALEMRGHGQSERRHPDVRYTFGIQETSDLMRVSDWLQTQPHVRRTGLLGYCWGASIVLLAAWYDGASPDDPVIAAALGSLAAPRDRRRFEAGIMACSPVLRYEEIIQELHTPHTKLSDPVLSAVQETVRERMERKGCASPSGDLLQLIHCELLNSPLNYNGEFAPGRDFLRILPETGLASRPKLQDARMPVIIVHGSNDPLCSAQDVADLVCQTSNTNVAAIVLSGGGHCGFAPYARDYFYSLLFDFFDPVHGAARLAPAQVPPVARAASGDVESAADPSDGGARASSN